LPALPLPVADLPEDPSRKRARVRTAGSEEAVGLSRERLLS
jgi:hypothetical protein